MTLLTFLAELEDVPRVSARVAVRSDQDLTALHDVMQQAFGWDDDHLYSFWLDGRYWGKRDAEYTRPGYPNELDEPISTADVAIESLDIDLGQRIAYVFDFGDEWRVRLTLETIEDEDDGEYPRVLERFGQAPPQYPDGEG